MRRDASFAYFLQFTASASCETAESTNPAEFRQGLPFLLNFHDAQIRYYRHKEKQSHASTRMIRAWLTKRDSRRWNGTMSITRFTTVLAALVTALALASNVHAQLFKPFAFPPHRVGLPVLRTGRHRHVRGRSQAQDGLVRHLRSRVHECPASRRRLRVTRETMGDFTWGNRIDLGFVDDDSKGWIGHDLAHRRSERGRHRADGTHQPVRRPMLAQTTRESNRCGTTTCV